jgi:lambda family phage minor tail protein L
MTTIPEQITSEIQKLDPSAIIELFILDATDLGGELYRFHAGTNELRTNIVWQGEEYVRFPVQVTGFEVNGQGPLPRPRLRVSNILSVITTLLMENQDLIGAKLIRKRTFKRHLDAVNFIDGNPSADPTAEYPDDVYYIDQKTAENRDAVEFELASAADLAGISLPRRQVIQNICVWKYRGGECGYTDDAYFDEDDNEITDPTKDRCGKRLSSCKKRFGPGGQLPFGGFPGAGLGAR